MKDETNRPPYNNFTEERSPALIERRELFSGPLPHPDLLQKYDHVVPGSAKEIINMAHEQARHREELERKIILSDIHNSQLGLWFGFIIGALGILSGAFLIYTGHEYTGTFLSGSTILSLVGVFVYGSQQRIKKEEE